MEMEEVFNGYADEEAKQDKSRVSAEDLPDFSIKMDNVSLKIGDREIVRGVDITIPAGAVVRLEGESGHGKTTIMKLMAGYYKPSDGHVKIGGILVDDIKKTGRGCLYRHTAYLSQRPYIFESDNLRKNLEFGGHDAPENEMRQVLEDLGLAERFIKKGKLNLDQSVTGLSGGERARLAVARTILKIRSMKGGGIVFLDEPSEGLDDKNGSALADALVREKKKHPDVTFVLVSHDNGFIEKLSAMRGSEKGLSVRSIKIKKGKVVNEPALRLSGGKPGSIEI
jgi:ABC-type transport system involved in cytochrome bd biosynthesis fused ATPase/permease subunit